MPITIHPVETWCDRRAFFNLPRALYANDACYIEPLRIELKERLNRKKNPFFRHGDAEFFLAKRGKEIVGRISAQIDHAAHPGENPGEGNFGFYEAIDDADVAQALFGAAGEWLTARRCAKMVGPYQFRLEDPAPGFLQSGHEKLPTFMMPYTKSYYVAQARANGFSTTMELNAYAVTKEAPPPESVQSKAREAAQIAGMRVREFNMARLYDEAEILRAIFNESLKNNWGYVPMSQSQVRAMVKNLKMLADPRIVLIAEVAGRPIGAVINLPNFNDIFADCRGRLFPKGLYRMLLRRRDIRGLRGYAFAILPEYQHHGVGCLLLAESWRRGEAAGYTYGEITWILGSNTPMNEIAQGLGGAPAKQYVLMGKSL